LRRGDAARAQVERTWRASLLERVWVQIASRRISAGGSCTPGETRKGCPTRAIEKLHELGGAPRLKSNIPSHSLKPYPH
jgi:hypothetical protein